MLLDEAHLLRALKRLFVQMRICIEIRPGLSAMTAGLTNVTRTPATRSSSCTALLAASSCQYMDRVIADQFEVVAFGELVAER
jgi:hypothetical protein